MQGKNNCENCGKDFIWKRYKNQTVARFCSKSCWYSWNGKYLSSFNEKRFQWNKATVKEVEERLKLNFEKKVIKKDGCWDWNGCVDKDGYPLMPSGYHKQSRAHRVSYEIFLGKIPKGKLVCHRCDNPICTNPDHLFIGDHRENQVDSINKGRAAVGIKQPKSKLKENDINEIKYKLSLGVTGRRIAKEYGVAPSQISNIKNGISWKHV
jgi:hypothetical protein